MDAAIRVEDRPGGLRVLTVSNPSKRNALDPALLEQLRLSLDPASAVGVRVLVVRGDGAHFCSGYDLAGLERLAPGGPLPDEPLQQTLAALEAYPAVTLACVRGGAFGAGAELALTCDLRLFGDDALFCLPPAKIGVVYAPEGLRRLSALVGPARAKLLFFTGRRLNPEQCWDWGLCEAVHDAAGVEAAAFQLAEEIAGNAPLAVAGMKRAFQLLAGPGPIDPQALAQLRELRLQAFLSEDAAEGRAALFEKRPPRFTGR